MCGICGVAYGDPTRPPDRAMLERMAGSLHHRGPDSRGFHAAPGIGLGVARLRIVDLETGDQPIANEDGSLTLVCNGEIYNHGELRQRLIAAGHRFRTRSDVEVILHLYEEHGVDCLRHLRGMFAFALWDAREGQLLLARDRLGIKPLHYASTGEGCFFGSEQKAILAADCVETRLDVHALADLFAFGYPRSPRTFVAGIRRVPPGHYLLHRGGAATLHEYWDLDFTPRSDGPRTEGEWSEALLAELTESVRVHLMSDVPVGAWLSAGLDSSTVTALMHRLGQRGIQAFTLGFEDAVADETSGARSLDDFPGYDLEAHRALCTGDAFELLPRALWHQEDPIVGGNEVPRQLLSAASSEHVKVVLTGEGADEVLGGYDYFRVDKLLRSLPPLPRPVRKWVGAVTARRHPRASRTYAGPTRMCMERYRRLVPIPTDPALLSSDVRRALAARPRDGPDELRVPDAFATWHPYAQLQYYDAKVRLLDRIELCLDRASMAHSVEARVPFLDHQLVDFCARIPPSLKMRGLREKDVLRRAMRDLLPPAIAQRRKRGLISPFRQWLSGPRPAFAAELLSPEALTRKGWFDPAAVARAQTRFERGVRQSERALMLVLLVQLWDELFLQKRSFGDLR